MEKDHAKRLAIAKTIEEEFTNTQVIAMTTELLLYIHKNNDFKVIQHLEKLKRRYKNIDIELEYQPYNE